LEKKKALIDELRTPKKTAEITQIYKTMAKAMCFFLKKNSWEIRKKEIDKKIEEDKKLIAYLASVK
jgi:hypothetical protein